ncbi:phosphate acyltransferase PlsX [Treponema sp. R6D11]
MKILIDATGGDNAPLAQINAVNSFALPKDVEIVLLGEKKKIGKYEGNFKKIYTENDVKSDDDVLYAIKNKKESSIATGLKLIADGEADCLISAGNTGVLAGMSSLYLRKIKNVRRMALAPVIKSYKSNFILLDAGINTNLSAEHYLQLGVMGSQYMKAMFGVKKPKVGLLKVGVEENKGTPELVEAYDLLKKSKLNFKGNIEAREASNMPVDVLVADGYAGNIFLKTMEGTAGLITTKLKEIIFSKLQYKIGGLLMNSGIGALKDQLDYRKYGGSAILGVNGLVVKAHGSSDEVAFKYAIKQAITLIENKMIENITKAIQ